MKEYPKHILLITQQVYSYTYRAQGFKHNNTEATKFRQVIYIRTSYEIITK